MTIQIAESPQLKQWRRKTAATAQDLQSKLDFAARESTPSRYRDAIFGRKLIGGGAPALVVSLASLRAPVVTNTFAGPKSLIDTPSVGPLSVDAFKSQGASWKQEAMGVISVTAASTPTIVFSTYYGVVANTITNLLAATPAITTASGIANIDWYYVAFGRVVANSGATSTMLVTALLFGNIEALGATAATEPVQYGKNATPPTAVTTDLSSSAFLDLQGTFSTSAVGNQITVNFYTLLSLSQ